MRYSALLALLFIAAPSHADDIWRKIYGAVTVSNFPIVQVVRPEAVDTATMSASVSISTTSVQIVKPNTARRGLLLYNNSSNSAYIAYDSTVNSATHMTFLIPTFSTWVMPTPIYTGAIAVIRNAGTGAILITEL